MHRCRQNVFTFFCIWLLGRTAMLRDDSAVDRVVASPSSYVCGAQDTAAPR